METAVCMKDIFHVRCTSYVILSCIIILVGISMMFFSPDTVSAAALMAGIIFILNGIIDIIMIRVSKGTPIRTLKISYKTTNLCQEMV